MNLLLWYVRRCLNFVNIWIESIFLLIWSYNLFWVRLYMLNRLLNVVLYLLLWLIYIRRIWLIYRLIWLWLYVWLIVLKIVLYMTISLLLKNLLRLNMCLVFNWCISVFWIYLDFWLVFNMFTTFNLWLILFMMFSYLLNGLNLLLINQRLKSLELLVLRTWTILILRLVSLIKLIVL